MTSDELAELRHGLKNVLTALRSGCELIESRQPGAGGDDVHKILAEMRAELKQGAALLDRLRDTQTPPSAP